MDHKNWFSHPISSYIGLILFGLFAFVFYHFVVFPLFLDFALYGVLAVLGFVGLFLRILPREQRLQLSVYFIGFLLVIRGLYRIEFKPFSDLLIAFLLLTITFLIISKVIVPKIRAAHILTLSLVAGVLFSLFTNEELFFSKHFHVLYKSPKLYVDTNVEYFPLQLADVTDDGKQEIITQGFVNHEYVQTGRTPLELEASQYMVFHYATGEYANESLGTNAGFVEIGTNPLIEPLVWDYVVRDYIGFPYYTTEWSSGNDVIHRYQDIRNQLLRQGMMQMDFFIRLEDELAVDIVGKLGISSSFLSLLRQDLLVIPTIAVDDVDNLGGSGDNLVDLGDNLLDDSMIVRDPGVNEQTAYGSGVFDIMIPTVDRIDLIHRMLPFGDTAFAALALSSENIDRQTRSWHEGKVESSDGTDAFIKDLEQNGAKIYGLYYLTEQARDQGIPELVVYQDGLEVYSVTSNLEASGSDEWELIAQLTPTMLRQVADGEFLFADITGDGIIEVLLSGTPSQVLQVVPFTDSILPYGWEQLWVAQDDLFRFEAVTDSQEIVALSQSFKRNENRRFLTGYEFINNEMKPVWRVNQSVINVRVGDVTGDGNDELVASYFRDHQFVVLKAHGYPVQEGAWLITLLALGLTWLYRRTYLLASTGSDANTTTLHGNSKNIPDSKNSTSTLIIIGLLILSLSVSSTGCNHTSSIESPSKIAYPTSDEVSIDGDRFTADEWQDYWNTAVNYTDENGLRFWYSGWVATKVQKRRTTSMFEGVVVRNEDNLEDHQIMINARLLGKPYRYYESSDYAFINEGGQWKRLVNESGYPVNWLERYEDSSDGMLPDDSTIEENKVQLMSLEEPFGAMAVLADIETGALQFTKLPMIVGTERILGAWCDKIVFTVEDPANRNATMEWTVWVGQEVPYIHQYEVDTLMPVPGAGMMQQKTFYRFWNYNDDTIQVTDPLAIEQQIVNRELRQIESIEYTLGTDTVRDNLTDTEIRLLELRLEILRNNVATSSVEN